MDALRARLEDDGTDVSFLVTGSPQLVREAKALAFDVTAGPVGAANRRPDCILWGVSDVSDPTLRGALSSCPAYLIDAGQDGRLPDAGLWPGRLARNLRRFQRVFAVDETAADSLRRAGASRVSVTGPFMDVTPPSDGEPEEQAHISQMLQNRPVWLAMSIDPDELALIIDTHRALLRRIPRLVLILVPEAPDDMALEFAERFQAENMPAQLWSSGASLSDGHQVLLADQEADPCLWYRLAPMVFMGGTFSGRNTLTPLDPVLLGCVVVHGPWVSRFNRAYGRLATQGASVSVATPNAVAPAIRNLLSADQAARYALAGWQVATAGAKAVNAVADAITALKEA